MVHLLYAHLGVLVNIVRPSICAVVVMSTKRPKSTRSPQGLPVEKRKLKQYRLVVMLVYWSGLHLTVLFIFCPLTFQYNALQCTPTYYDLSNKPEAELSPVRQCQQKLRIYKLQQSRIYGRAVVLLCIRLFLIKCLILILHACS